jgi:ketosteroid isomerase-like protein
VSASENKQRMREILTAMAGGSLAPLFDAMADDVRWRWMGTDQWSRTFEGKAAVVGGLFGAVQETLTPPFSVTVNAIVAEGDTVVVEHTGRNTTRDGRRYDNNYCRVCRFEGGRLREVREYMDTQLVTETFGPDAS